MSDYANLPGINVTRLDGGLTASQSNTAPVILLLGTAPQGVGDEPYYCADESRALAAFGASSDLYRGFVEAKRAYGDGANVWLYRVGTTPATLRISGMNGKYVDVVPRNRVATVGDTYLGSFNGATNTLWIYDSNQNLVYSNYANNSVDSGAVDVRGDLTLLSGARSWGDPANGTYAGSVPGRARLQALAPLTEPGPVREALSLTTEAVALLRTLGRQPYHDLPDVGEALLSARVSGVPGGTLSRFSTTK